MVINCIHGVRVFSAIVSALVGLSRLRYQLFPSMDDSREMSYIMLAISFYPSGKVNKGNQLHK